jgi:hypothetical protein
MQKTYRIVLFSLLFAGLVLAACQTGGPSGTPGSPLNLTVIAPTLESGYPAPNQIQGAYPGPAQIEPTQPLPPAVDVTADLTMGRVTGVLQLLAGGSATPVAGQTLYLARVLMGSDGQERAASFDPQTDPRAQTDERGGFQFVNVPPGRYGLVMDIVIESYLLNDPISGESLLITVTAGEELSMGELVYTTLPVPDS